MDTSAMTKTNAAGMDFIASGATRGLSWGVYPTILGCVSPTILWGVYPTILGGVYPRLSYTCTRGCVPYQTRDLSWGVY